MPSRLIRDGLLESEAVLSLPIEGRWLYVSILLIADDVGLFEATEFRLSRKADLRREIVASMLGLLADRDLIRLYTGPDGRTLGFIPKFAQRLQIKRTKLPPPPPSLYADDLDAVKKFKDLASITTVGHGSPRLANGATPPEPEPEPEHEGKPEEKGARKAAAPPPPPRRGPTMEELMVLPKWSKAESLWVLAQEGVDATVAATWMACRKHLTPLAWKAVKREAEAACITPAEAVQFSAERGYTGFQAAWYSRVHGGAHGTKPGASKSVAGMDYNKGVDDDGNIL